MYFFVNINILTKFSGQFCNLTLKIRYQYDPTYKIVRFSNTIILLQAQPSTCIKI